MQSPQPSPCPHCRDKMPPGFLFCRVCWRELPAAFRIDLWTTQGQAHHKDLYPHGEAHFTAAQTRAQAHLRQHSTALI